VSSNIALMWRGGVRGRRGDGRFRGRPLQPLRPLQPVVSVAVYSLSQ
jgi:hypothetical protein